MTRILYWNLRNFSLPKVRAYQQYQETAAKDRLDYMLKVFRPSVPPPLDIIIIVEVFGRTVDVAKNNVVLPSDRPAASGLFSLLDSIRGRLGDTWCLIPPIMGGEYGKREAVAVYYNSANLTFAGPNVYAMDRDGIPTSLAPTPERIANLADYGIVYNKYLPIHRNRSWNAAVGMVPESQGAGKADFGFDFPNKGDRPPFFVRMIDNNQRTIKVFAVHTSPRSAYNATEKFGLIPEVQTVRAGEVGVVVGDFNVDLFTLPKLKASPYNELRKVQRYKMLLDPCKPNTNRVAPFRRPYCLTHLLPNVQERNPSGAPIATPYNADGIPPDPQHNVYPRLGYMGGMNQNNETTHTGALDNAFVRYGTGMAEPAHNTTIVNPVVGQPYTRQNPPADVTQDLTSGLPEAPMLAPDPPIPDEGFPPGSDIGDFNDWSNFGHVYSTSDHLPLIFDV